MKTQRLAIALTIINLGLTVFLLVQLRRVTAEDVAPSTQATPASQVAPVIASTSTTSKSDVKFRRELKPYPHPTA